MSSSSSLISIDLSGLNVLLKAPSKQVVDKLINYAFIFRNSIKQKCVDLYMETLDLDSEEEATELLDALLECVRISLHSTSLQDIIDHFKSHGSKVNPKLIALILQCISSHLDDWKEASTLSLISLPKLLDFDLKINFQKATSEINVLNIPSVIVSLNIQDQETNINTMPSSRPYQFELNKESLDTMIEGFGRIRDQLTKIST